MSQRHGHRQTQKVQDSQTALDSSLRSTPGCPRTPELRIDTTEMSPEEAADLIIARLIP